MQGRMKPDSETVPLAENEPSFYKKSRSSEDRQKK